MYLKKLMNKRNLTRAELSHKSGIPESTLRDILSGATQFENCKAITLLCLADALETSVEDLMEHYFDEFFSKSEDDDEDEDKMYPDDWYDEEKNEGRGDMHLIPAERPISYFYMIVESTTHGLKNHSAKEFVLESYEYHWVESFLHNHWIREALFMVGLLDCLCRKCGMKPNPAYETLRKMRLDEPVYSMNTMLKASNRKAFANICLEAELESIPELARHNIYLTEDDIRPKALCPLSAD